MALTTLSAFKTASGISGSSYDAMLTPIVNGVIELVLQELKGRTFAAAEVTKRIDGSGTSDLRLPQYPIAGVSRVCVDAAYDFPEDNDLEEDEDFVVDDTAGILTHLGDGWPPGRRNVLVVWTSDDAVPADLTMAVHETIMTFFNREQQFQSGQNPNEMLSESLGGQREETYRPEMTALGIPGPALAIIRKYTERSV